MAKKTDRALGEVAEQGLSSKEEAFAQALFETGCQSTAYRKTTRVRKNTKPESIWVEASKLANNPKVAQRVEELRDAAREKQADKNVITLEIVTEHLLDALKMAKKQSNAKEVRCAAMDLGKLHGLVVDRSENKNINVNLSDILRQRFKDAKTIDA